MGVNFARRITSEAKADADAPPAISREDRLDLLLKDLIASVSTAIAEYQTESTSEIPEGLEPEKPVDATLSDAAEEALRQSEKLEDAVKATRPPVEELKKAGVALAETLGRQLTDVETNASAARAELQSEEARPSQLEMLAWANRALPEVLEKTGIAIEKIAATAEFAQDVSKPVRDWMRKLRRDGLALVLASVKEFGKALRETASVWKTKSVGEPTKTPPSEPPPDFDLEKAHEMILSGKPPPVEWRPWIDKLNFNERNLKDLAPLAELTALRSLDLHGTHVVDLVPIAGLAALQSLYLYGTQVADLAPLAGLAALQGLLLANTQVADLTPLAGLSLLQTLSLDGTQVSDLGPIAGLSALQSLSFSGTQVNDLAPLSRLTQLKSLHLDNTPVRDLKPLAGLTALERLYVSKTQVSDLAPLAGLRALQSLSLSRTPVSDLAPLADLSALEWLILDSTGVIDLAPLANLSSLQNLSLVGTQVHDIAPLAGLASLRMLDFIAAMRVSDLAPLAGLIELRDLRLAATSVKDLTPLAGLDALKYLNIGITEIVDLAPLASLPRLRRLEIMLTKINDLAPLASLTALRDVLVETDDRRAELARTLGKRGEIVKVSENLSPEVWSRLLAVLPKQSEPGQTNG